MVLEEVPIEGKQKQNLRFRLLPVNDIYYQDVVTVEVKAYRWN